MTAPNSQDHDHLESELATARQALREARSLTDEGARVAAEIERLLRLLAGARLDAEPALVDEALVELCQPATLADLGGASFDIELLASLGLALAEAAEAEVASGASNGAVTPLRLAVWRWLDLARRAPLPALINAADAVPRWIDLELRLVEASRYTVGRMLTQRVESYGPQTIFRVPSAGDLGNHSWLGVAARTSRIARGLVTRLDELGDGAVAIVSENRYEMALCDLACLCHGIVDVMIAPHSTPADIEYMIRDSGAAVAVVSTEQHYRRVAWDKLDKVHTVVILEHAECSAELRGAMGLFELEHLGRDVSEGVLVERDAAIELDALATVMYTSGSTGRPKGIRFSQRNMISKRFARGLAIPSIDDHAVLLSYLPLCHTFGRYFEMMGAIFWGGTYVFVEDTSIDAMLELFAAQRPTVFISIPLKWVQLHEQICRRADPATASDAALAAATREVIGDRLSVGVSAAGYLAPEIFRFFQRQGVELMSGFGMTEATGGITMTPPGGYRPGSLGKPLPAIDVRLDEDGEMLIRGPYVTSGYLAEEDNVAGFRDGWLRTGDVMRLDAEGYYEIVDRKKDIFKNVKGETIAPQRVESLLAENDAIAQAIVIGDHRPYNTALIVPALDAVEGVDLRGMSAEARREYFLSLVMTVNRFLSPFERIVDFATLERGFSEERGELTRKGSLRRRQIEEAFSETIARLYQRGQYELDDGIAVRLSAWLIQALGVPVQGIEARGDTLSRPAEGGERVSLTIAPGRDAEGQPCLRIGSCLYRFSGQQPIDVSRIVRAPALWLGNDELTRFAPLSVKRRFRARRPPRAITLVGRAVPSEPDAAMLAAAEQALLRQDAGLEELELAAVLLGAAETQQALLGVRLLGRVLTSQTGPAAELARAVLRNAAGLPAAEVRRAALQVLLPAEHGHWASPTVARFLSDPEELLDLETRGLLCESTLSDEVVDALVALVQRLVCDEATDEGPGSRATARRLTALVDLLVEYGAAHPGKYAELRHALARLAVFARRDEDRLRARQAREELVERFRRWLGPPQRVAVDPETHREYRWEDVVSFDEEIEEGDRQRLMAAIRGTSLLQEAVFLLAETSVLHLSDIPPGGIWVTQLWRRSGKTTYRATIFSRHRGHFDITIGVNHATTAEDLSADLLWQQVLGHHRHGSVVPRFGGYWRQLDVWTEQYLGRVTADVLVDRLARADRLASSWASVCYNGALATFACWQRTHGEQIPGDLTPGNLVLPSDDYKIGPRLVSVSHRRRFVSVEDLLGRFHDAFVTTVRTRHAEDAGETPWESILAALVEVCGVERGLELIDGIDGSGGAPLGDELQQAARRYAGEVRQRGFVPRRLHFAIERYRGWAALAGASTTRARATMLQELAQTYNLDELRHGFPETRVRLFRETVFADGPEWLRGRLDELIDELRRGRLGGDELAERLVLLRGHAEATEEIEFFLTRLSYPHLSPEDTASFLADGSGRWADVVVSRKDANGRPFSIRPPVSPKEIGALHRLFVASSIDVGFLPDHQFLVAVDEREMVVAGVFYGVDHRGEQAHLEKIVVSEHARNTGVGDGLMTELFKRLAASGVRNVTTGFYRRGYFYRLGFRVEGRYAGLVKHLTPPGS